MKTATFTPLTAGMVFALVLSDNAVLAQKGEFHYPETRKSDTAEIHFGKKIADPYRWLENLNDDETLGWIVAQNRMTSNYLARIPAREKIQKRITELWNYPKTDLPFREGGRLFYLKNSGLQKQSVLCMRRSITSPSSVVLDPNRLSPDGSVALTSTVPSPDGRLLAYSLSEGGADWNTVHVRDLATGKDLSDTVRWMRFSNLSWTKDGKGFFYSRYPEPPPGKKLEAALRGHALYYHRIGTSQSEDRLVYRRKDLPTWVVEGGVTEDGRYLLVTISRGAEPRNRLYVADLGDPMRPDAGAAVQPLIETDDALYWAFGNVGSVLYICTDQSAPNRKVVTIDMAHPHPSRWNSVIPESRYPLEDVLITGDRIAAQYLVDVKSDLVFYEPDGTKLETVQLPGIGSVGDLSGRQDTTEFFYSFTSALYPTTVFSYDIRKKQSTPFEAPRIRFDSGKYETRQFFAMSKGGTRIPYFTTARKKIRLDGTNPTLLYAYGGFAISETPRYRADMPVWLEQGGVYVSANLRGGGEYGEAWHRSGMLDKKQNVFDDCIAVSEDLFRRGYTSPSKLAIRGGSNGGLLVGAVMTQRPDLCAVALPAVGVMDMLRYDRFTGGALWVTEYGSPSNAKAFRYLLAYSPLHNIKSGTCYPATFVTTADFDDRVVPSHSYKFTAALQAAQACNRPVLIRVETKGSHGYKPTDKRIAELADMWAFTMENLGMRIHY